MKTTEYLLEPFLTQFYLHDAIYRDFADGHERRELYEELARVFCLTPDSGLETYYRLSSCEPFDTIRDFQSYERLCRTVEFAENCGRTAGLTYEDRVILAQKREAMLIKSKLFEQEKNLTKETICDVLLDTAMNGSISAMGILAYMEYHGIGLCRDTDRALKRIRLCADWNDLFGMLMGVAYDTENKQRYYDGLYTVLDSIGRKQTFAYICSATKHTGECRADATAKIVERAFGLKIIDRGVYDHMFAKVAFSKIVSAKDKEKLLLNRPRDFIASVSGIPFDLEDSFAADFDESCMEDIPLRRKVELRQIKQNITVALSCPPEVYKPLLVVAEDAYIGDIYSGMLKDGFGEGVSVEIDCGTLTVKDLLPSRENIFLRGLSDTKAERTVFLLKNCEELDGECLSELLKMLDYTYRRRFKLFDPTVSLDLSKLMFIMFSGAYNTAVRLLAKCCDTVWTERVNGEEKLAAIDSLFAERARSFGCEKMTLSDGGRRLLADYGTEQIQQMVDRALRCAIYEKAGQVTLAHLESLSCERPAPGAKHGFGYIGGGYNA